MKLKDKTSEQLKQIIATTSDVKEKVNALRMLAYKLLESNPSNAFQLYQRSVVIANDHQYLEGAGRTMAIAGHTKYHSTNYPAAIEFYQKALTLFESIDHQEGLALSHGALGRHYSYLGDCPKAFQYLQKALTISEAIGDIYKKAINTSAIGNVFLTLAKQEKAIEYYQQALNLFKAIDQKEEIAWCTFKIGDAYHGLAINDKALHCFQQALIMAEKIAYNWLIGLCHIAIAGVFRDSGNFQEALEYSDDVRTFVESTNNRNGISVFHAIYSDIHKGLGNLPEAIEHILKAIQISDEIGRLAANFDYHKQLADLYKEQGQWQRAFEAYKLYDKLKSEIKSAEAQKIAANLEIQKQLTRAETEREVTNRMLAEVKKARDRSETLLLNILPSKVAEELKDKGTATARLFNDVTVLYTDFKSFTQLSERLSPQQLVNELNICFSAFDEIAGRYNIEKIKTIGDAYMAVSGLPLVNPNHASDVINAAIEIRDFMLARKAKTSEVSKTSEVFAYETFEVRIGVHSGSVVAGIVGVKKFAYDIWGDTVNTAARMEQNSEAGKINISETTYQLVRDKFTCVYRGEIEAKNKGKLKMYFVE